jgi:hypothetical protein
MNKEDFEVGDDLEFTKIERRSVGGTWVNGTLNGHRFSALVFPQHAENPDYEIEDSKISKLWIQRISDKKTVFNWDRGEDIAAQTPAAEIIVGFLCAGLADHTYAE